jgi:hypothetical protein
MILKVKFIDRFREGSRQLFEMVWSILKESDIHFWSNVYFVVSDGKIIAFSHLRLTSFRQRHLISIKEAHRHSNQLQLYSIYSILFLSVQASALSLEVLFWMRSIEFVGLTIIGLIWCSETQLLFECEKFLWIQNLGKMRKKLWNRRKESKTVRNGFSKRTWDRSQARKNGSWLECSQMGFMWCSPQVWCQRCRKCFERPSPPLRENHKSDSSSEFANSIDKNHIMPEGLNYILASVKEEYLKK